MPQEEPKAAHEFGFNTIGLNEIVSVTVPMNNRSLPVMERIGLRYNPEDDFRHPSGIRSSVITACVVSTAESRLFGI